MTDKSIRLPAFACAAENGHQEGMALRDYFASAAMQAFTINACRLNVAGITPNHAGEKGHSAVAKYSYELADAMLKARDE